MSLIESLKSVGTLLMGRIFAKSLSFFFILSVARVSGVDQVGQLSLLLALSSGITILVGHGVPIFFLKCIPTSAQQKYQFLSGAYLFLSLSAIFILISSLALFCLAYLNFLGADLGTGFAFAITLIIPYGTVQLVLAALRALERDSSVVLIEILSACIPILILYGVSLYYANPASFDVRFAVLASYLGVSALSFFWVLTLLDERGNGGASLGSIKLTAKASRPFMWISLSMFANGYVSVFLVYALLGDAQLGVFHILNSLAGICLLILSVVNGWVAPKYAKSWKDADLRTLRELSWRANGIAFLLSMPIFIALVLFGEQILSFYEISSRTAYSTLLCMVLFQCVNLYFCSAGYLLAMTGNNGFYAKLVLASACVDGFLTYALAPSIGLLGAAVGGGLGLVIWNLGCFYKCQQVLGFSPSWYPTVKLEVKFEHRYQAKDQS